MMLGILSKKESKRVIGIDASTKSIAFAVFDNKRPVKCGEIQFYGANVFERIRDAKPKISALVKDGTLKGDYIVIESAIMVRNVQTALDLAYIYGMIIGELMTDNLQVEQISPISWQTGLGNKNLTKKEKDDLRAQNPGRKESWYRNESRKIRKARTLSIAKNFFAIPGDSENVADAIGLALWATKTQVRK